MQFLSVICKEATFLGLGVQGYYYHSGKQASSSDNEWIDHDGCSYQPTDHPTNHLPSTPFRLHRTTDKDPVEGYSTYVLSHKSQA